MGREVWKVAYLLDEGQEMGKGLIIKFLTLW